MPHLNHRRGDHRRRGRNHYGGQYAVAGIGHWNRIANRRLRGSVSEVLQALRTRGYPRDLLDDLLFPIAHEVEDVWNYD